MKCREFQGLIEPYLRETIDESRREAFEEHFFGCQKCFLGLKINETLQGKNVRIPLAEKPRLLVFKTLRPVLVMSSLFLVIVLSVLLVRSDRRSARLRELARFDLPLYHQSELRALQGSAADGEFARAMRFLQAREFRRALDILEQPPFAVDNPKAAFFRAVCYLGGDEAEKAGAVFDRIIRDMDPSYFDEALYYKGFVLLRQGRLAQAREQFSRLAAMLSPMAGRARAMVQKIDGLS